MGKNTHQINERWPEGAIVYQIYPRSFQDSNNDGVGDLRGICSRLEYLQELGVNALWLSPFYPSPMADFGYDVADYCNVDPIFGTLDDFKILLTESHKRNLKVIIDLVPNHTSDVHPWFKKSRRSRNNTHADWYIWRNPHRMSLPDNKIPPNNWRDALTGGSAWEWVPEREQYYLHSFDVKQPDLNWSNSAVREAIKDSMRFWLDLGVDGFRIDAVYWLGKDPLLADDDRNTSYREGEDLTYHQLKHNNSQGWPFVYAYLAEMAAVLKEDAYRGSLKFMVTEAYPDRHNPVSAYLDFYVGVDSDVAAPFNFEGLILPWEAGPWRKFLRSFHNSLQHFDAKCVPSYAFGNHDQPRLASRLPDEASRSALVMLLTLPGMIFCYYGDELGMKDVPIPPELVQDPAAKGDPKAGRGRDPQRTPMQWSNKRNAGFSSSNHTWLPVGPDYKDVNVETLLSDPFSTLNLFKALCHLRNQLPELAKGQLKIIPTPDPYILVYSRACNQSMIFVFINFDSKPHSIEPVSSLSEFLVSSHPNTQLPHTFHTKLQLLPYEAAVLRGE